MFKKMNTDWLKPALRRVYQSGWTILVLVVLSLVFCNLHGSPAFLVWWLAFSGVVLIGYSIFLGNLPYRLIQPDRFVSRYACAFSWVVWGVGVILICLSPLYAEPVYLLFLEPAGVVLGFMFCRWVCRKGMLAWIQ